MYTNNYKCEGGTTLPKDFREFTMENSNYRYLCVS